MKKFNSIAIACIAFFAATTLASTAQTVSQVFSFDGADGSSPDYGKLVQGANGNFYGTTSIGGTVSADCPDFGGCGTVFEVTPTGVLTTLYTFCALPSCADGFYPKDGLILGTNGNFYGTTVGGFYGNFGTIFELTPAGVLTTLHTFSLSDGAAPSELIQASNGSFYGTTGGGGSGANCTRNGGCGTIFAMTPSGHLTTLYNFCTLANCADGAVPFAGVVQARNGKFYGTTNTGSNSDAFYGTVFSISVSGGVSTFHTLYTFCSVSNCDDGEFPQAPMMLAKNGDLYGTTMSGGDDGAGTIFKVTPTGTFSSVVSFNVTNGSQPVAGLMQATNGNFYGTTSSGGNRSYGNVFEMTPAGRILSLYTFDQANGGLPYGGLFQAASGILYGITSQGGSNGAGTVFSVTLP